MQHTTAWDGRSGVPSDIEASQPVSHRPSGRRKKERDNPNSRRLECSTSTTPSPRMNTILNHRSTHTRMSWLNRAQPLPIHSQTPGFISFQNPEIPTRRAGNSQQIKDLHLLCNQPDGSLQLHALIVPHLCLHVLPTRIQQQIFLAFGTRQDMHLG